MTNAKIVQLAKILTFAANSDMRAARASLKRNLARGAVGDFADGHVTITGTHKGNVDVSVDVADRWNVHCYGGAGDFIIGATAAKARAFLIDLYVIVDDSEKVA